MKQLLLFILTPIFAFAQHPSLQRQKENLTAFTKLYGNIRYFHPADEANSIDWNYFAVYGAKVVTDAADDTELLKKLQALFSPIAPSVQIYFSNQKKQFDIKSITPTNKGQYEAIAWQHSGVDLDNSGSIYKSIRINRPEKKEIPTSSFAPITQYIDGPTYAGKKIKFRGWMKMQQNNSQGAGYFWLRVDKASGSGFFYNMNDRPVTYNQWKQYEFDATIDKDAKEIYFGAYLKGWGSLLIDNIELLVFENEQWMNIPIKNASFEQTKNLQPSDWLFGAIKNGSPNNAKQYAIDTSNDAQHGKQSTKIYLPQDNNNKTLSKPLFSNYPKPGELIEKQLTNNISATIPIALYGNDTATYPMAEKALLAELNNNISEAKNLYTSGNMQEVRLADVTITWNIFKHFFPYWQDASKNAAQILNDALTKALQDESSSDFLITLKLMTEPLNDGHIWVSQRSDTSTLFTIPILATVADGKLVVEKVFNDSLNNTIAAGDIIEMVNETSAMQKLARDESYISGSPQWKRSRATTEYFMGNKNSNVQLKLIHDDKPITINLQRNLPSRMVYQQLSLRIKSGPLKNDLYYVDLNIWPIDSIKKNIATIKNAKGVIFDLRGYPNGNHEVISYLLNEKEKTEWMFVPQIIYPDYEKVEYSGTGWNTQPNTKNKINGKVVFITDGRAISYAESFMGHIKDFKLATIVGQPTAGTNGNINPFILPGGYRISWTGMLVKNHDGSKHHLIGIVPDIPVERSITGIKTGKDELLEKAIEVVEN